MMNILALDTSGPVCSVAVMAGDSLRYEARAVNRLTHSRSLLPMVEEALHKSGIPREELGLIACVTGPGSFTGVRIGVAAAQGIGRALNLPCLGVNALEAMAYSLLMTGFVVCPIRDARGGQVYGAAFLDGNRLMPDAALKLEEYLRQVAPLGERLCFAGDGALAYGARIRDILGEKALITPPHLLQPGASGAAMLACLRRDEGTDPGELRPTYLRAPQAERLRAQQQHDA